MYNVFTSVADSDPELSTSKMLKLKLKFAKLTLTVELPWPIISTIQEETGTTP